MKGYIQSFSHGESVIIYKITSPGAELASDYLGNFICIAAQSCCKRKTLYYSLKTLIIRQYCKTSALQFIPKSCAH